MNAMTDKTKEYNRDYYSRPDVKEAHAKYMREYYQKNKEELLLNQPEYYLENKDRFKNYMKVYMRTYKKKKSDLGVDDVDPVS